MESNLHQQIKSEHQVSLQTSAFMEGLLGLLVHFIGLKSAADEVVDMNADH